jgi:hypothetical protein
MGKRRGSYRVLVGKPEGRSLGRCRYRWKDNLKMDPWGVGCWHGFGKSGSKP